MQDQNQPFNPFNTQPEQTPPPVPPQPTQPPIDAPQPIPPQPMPSAPNDPVPTPPVPAPIAPIGPPSPELPTPQPPKAGPSKRLIIIIIAIAILLIGGGIAAAVMLLGGGTKNGNTANSSLDKDVASTLSAGEKESITITDKKDFKEVCNGKKIANAKAISGSDYKISAYQARPNVDSWSFTGFVGKNEKYTVWDINETNTVLCIGGDEDKTSTPKSCEAKNLSTNQSASFNYIGTTYTATFYAAQTGEKLSETSIIKSSDICPQYTTTPSIVNGNMYAVPDSVDLDTAVDALLSNA